MKIVEAAGDARRCMKEYVIERSAAPVPLCGDPAAGPWASAKAAAIDEFPWYRSGDRQSTAVRALYDAEALYLQFLAADRHIFAKVTELNGPVCTDSCVELFATVAPPAGPDYFNFEANCCGTFHLGFGPRREDRRLVGADLAAGIEVATSTAAATRAERPDDDGWWLAARIPFGVLSELAGSEVRPRAGTVWRGNFYRCGGKTDPQFACWNPVATPSPDFHRPEFFATIRFAAGPATRP